MTKPLREKVARAIYEWQPSVDWNDVLVKPSHKSTGLRVEHYKVLADAAIAAVLEHFSDPANVTDEMVDAGVSAFWTMDDDKTINWARRNIIAAAMRAAKES